jgi:hypothetical protein
MYVTEIEVGSMRAKAWCAVRCCTCAIEFKRQRPERSAPQVLNVRIECEKQYYSEQGQEDDGKGHGSTAIRHPLQRSRLR